jgi:hypothetical protein
MAIPEFPNSGNSVLSRPRNSGIFQAEIPENQTAVLQSNASNILTILQVANLQIMMQTSDRTISSQNVVNRAGTAASYPGINL